jgi:hypothetical protein
MHIKFRALLLVSIIIIFSMASIIHAIDKTPEQLVKEAAASVENVSIHELMRLIESNEEITILDVREENEFKKEHLPGAMHISRGVLEFLVNDKIPDKNSRIVVY